MAESLHILLGTSACLQWLCHSGERTMARGPLVNILCPGPFWKQTSVFKKSQATGLQVALKFLNNPIFFFLSLSKIPKK